MVFNVLHSPQNWVKEDWRKKKRISLAFVLLTFYIENPLKCYTSINCFNWFCSFLEFIFPWCNLRLIVYEGHVQWFVWSWIKVEFNFFFKYIFFRIVTTIDHIWENNSQTLPFCLIQISTYKPFVDQLKLVLFCMDPMSVKSELWREYSFLSFYWYTVSSGFREGSPDICCIVEYGVSGTMLISCFNPKNKTETAKSTFWITAVILLYLQVFKVKLSKHPFAYLYHDF